MFLQFVLSRFLNYGHFLLHFLINLACELAHFYRGGGEIKRETWGRENRAGGKGWGRENDRL